MKTINAGNFWLDLKYAIKCAAREKNKKLSPEEERFANIFLAQVLENADGIGIRDLKNITNIPKARFFETMSMLESFALIIVERTRKKENSPILAKIKPAEAIEGLIRKNCYAQTNAAESNIPELQIPKNAKITQRGKATIIEIPEWAEEKGLNGKKKKIVPQKDFPCPIIINVGQTNEVRKLLIKNKIVSLKALFSTWKNIDYAKASIESLEFYLNLRHKELCFEITGTFPDCFIRNMPEPEQKI